MPRHSRAVFQDNKRVVFGALAVVVWIFFGCGDGCNGEPGTNDPTFDVGDVESDVLGDVSDDDADVDADDGVTIDWPESPCRFDMVEEQCVDDDGDESVEEGDGDFYEDTFAGLPAGEPNTVLWWEGFDEVADGMFDESTEVIYVGPADEEDRLFDELYADESPIDPVSFAELDIDESTPTILSVLPGTHRIDDALELSGDILLTGPDAETTEVELADGAQIQFQGGELAVVAGLTIEAGDSDVAVEFHDTETVGVTHSRLLGTDFGDGIHFRSIPELALTHTVVEGFQRGVAASETKAVIRTTHFRENTVRGISLEPADEESDSYHNVFFVDESVVDGAGEAVDEPAVGIESTASMLGVRDSAVRGHSATDDAPASGIRVAGSYLRIQGTSAVEQNAGPGIRSEESRVWISDDTSVSENIRGLTADRNPAAVSDHFTVSALDFNDNNPLYNPQIAIPGQMEVEDRTLIPGDMWFPGDEWIPGDMWYPGESWFPGETSSPGDGFFGPESAVEEEALFPDDVMDGETPQHDYGDISIPGDMWSEGGQFFPGGTVGPFSAAAGNIEDDEVWPMVALTGGVHFDDNAVAGIDVRDVGLIVHDVSIRGTEPLGGPNLFFDNGPIHAVSAISPTFVHVTESIVADNRGAGLFVAGGPDAESLDALPPAGTLVYDALFQQNDRGGVIIWDGNDEPATGATVHSADMVDNKLVGAMLHGVELQFVDNEIANTTSADIDGEATMGDSLQMSTVFGPVTGNVAHGHERYGCVYENLLGETWEYVDSGQNDWGGDEDHGIVGPEDPEEADTVFDGERDGWQLDDVE